jgi:hypothetical protein
MASNPIFEENLASQANTLIDQFADATAPERPLAEVELNVGMATRQFCIYPARAGYELQRELDFLSNRAMEANVFFTGRFLAPAMPRLDDRLIRLLLIRDEDARRSRMRLLMPFSVEKPGFAVGPSIIRVWSSPFGPLGTPLVDAEGAAETLDNLLEGLARPQASLPSVLVMPDMRLNGPVTELLRAVAIARGLPVTVTGQFERPVLQSREEGDAYLARAISRPHLKEMRRQWRQLESMGRLQYQVSRQPEEVRVGLETFLALEASGWKGKRKSAMVADRYRAAFAREAVTNLALMDNARIHELKLDGRTIATMVVFVISGEAYTWKTAFDEEFAAYSPGSISTIRTSNGRIPARCRIIPSSAGCGANVASSERS